MLEKMSSRGEISTIKENIKRIKEENINENNAEEYYKNVIEQMNVIQTQVSRDLDKIEDKKSDANEMENNLRNVGILFDGKEGEFISKLKSIINSYDSAFEFDALKFDLCFQLLRQQNVIIGSMKGMHVSSEITQRFTTLIEKVFDEKRKAEDKLQEQYQKNLKEQFDMMFQIVKDQNDKFIERMTMNDLILKQMVSAIGGTQKDFESIKIQLQALKDKSLVYVCNKCSEKFKDLGDLENHKKIHELDELKKKQEEELLNQEKQKKQIEVQKIKDAVYGIQGKREQARYLIENTNWTNERISYEIQTPTGIIKSVREEVDKLKKEGIGLEPKSSTGFVNEEEVFETLEDDDSNDEI